MQIRTTIRYHFTRVMVANIKIKKKKNLKNKLTGHVLKKLFIFQWPDDMVAILFHLSVGEAIVLPWKYLIILILTFYNYHL